MKAIRVDGFGGPEVLVPVELADPVPGAGEVVIAAEAVDTLYVETQIRGGWGPRFGMHPPFVPGGAAAGTVVAVGGGVAPDWLGRRALAAAGSRGTYAELVRVPLERLVPVPDGLGLQEAAALAHDGVTGASIAARAGITAGARVLILGAAGGMGTLLVQFAVAAGAEVIGAARGGPKIELVRRLGAHRAVDYGEDGWTDLVGGPVDILLDGVGGELGRAAFPLVRDGGWVSSHGAPSGGFAEPDPQDARRRGITLSGIKEVQLDPAQVQQFTAFALGEAAAGRLKPVIARTFPLAEAALAHRAIEAREVPGKALLIP
ncbi:zinc-binding dehydrogenase [Streptomyces sp. BR123]|uniref:zinc-binding dehydrogenase n=1 Tax=Streptomyces sp. BR123 TaxID=2749828 RepID=UPI0015C42B75|nr:zinc-binding dehydrogenase [Streptomyces sp. BR123]NXY96283.1 zinc-binding dehydrogenase [Streptomyces sp. BR123]